MARTTEPQVRDLIDNSTTISLVPFIETASGLVTWLITKDTDGVLTTELLELIERWLAAHFYETRDPQYSSKNTGRSGASFQGQTAMILMSSKWGQTACLLDVTGVLAQKSKDAETGTKRKARLTWLGTDGDRAEGAGAQDPWST